MLFEGWHTRWECSFRFVWPRLPDPGLQSPRGNFWLLFEWN